MYEKKKVALLSLKENEYKWHKKQVCMTYVVMGFFFLASDYRWLMGARRYFAIDVRIFPPDQYSFSLYRPQKLLV